MLGLFGDRDKAKYIRDGKSLELKITIIDSNEYVKEDNLFEENSIFIFLFMPYIIISALKVNKKINNLKNISKIVK